MVGKAVRFDMFKPTRPFILIFIAIPRSSAPTTGSARQGDPQLAFDLLETVDIDSIPESDLLRACAALCALRNEYRMGKSNIPLAVQTSVGFISMGL
jgi:hypothetical protein